MGKCKGDMFYSLQRCGLILQYGSEAEKNNILKVKLAVGSRGMALEFASTEMRRNRDVVIKSHFM